MGRHKAAVDVYHEAERVSPTDWEVHHNKGLCYMYLKRYKEAEESFLRANDSSRHDTTFIQLAKVYTLQEKYKEAMEAFE
ncbi:tetratricopeptide repeat protein, partial [archaeon]